jgi:DNA topoisomerase-1
MRTDSTNLSEYALQNLAQEITRSYGSQYLQTRQYKTNKANAQEAHEAIRPTYPDRQLVSQDRDQQRLYELIWKRTIASQMADAELERTVVNIGISTIVNARLVAEGEVMKFDGFLKVYLESKDEGEEEDTKGMLPPLSIGQVLPLNELVAMERFTKPAARFTEASLVKKLEELGIGRPSTYAPTISKIMEEGRGYVVKDSRDGNPRKYNMIRLKDGNIQKSTDMEMVGATKNMLYPTDMGMLVCDFLDEHFTQVMNYGFTAEIEQEFDTIAHGGKDWTKMLGKFYHPFHELVGKTIKDADRATGERLLGIDPESGRTVLVRMSKLGPVVQLGKTEELGEQEKPKYGNLKPGQSMENISFEEAMELFKLPKVVGKHADGTEITVGAGRFGPYIKYNETYISLPRAEDPLSVTLERAVELIQEKMEADKPVTTYEGMPVTKGKGRFGPFIKWNSLFINVPKKYDFDNLSQSDCNELIAAKIEKEGNRYVKVWEAEKIMIENGRWGPFIRFGKNMINLPKIDGQRATSESAAQISLEEVKKLIEAQIPDAFAPKKKAAPKKK